MSHHTTHREDIKKLNELIQDIDIAMLVTQEADGSLRSRPMATQAVEFDGDLWFFTDINSGKVDEAQQNRQVNVSYSEPDDQTYVSLSGTATIVRDQAKINELWNPTLKAWFPDGKESPNVALMKIHVTQAEYWDSPSSAMVALYGMAKAIVTGNSPTDIGDNEKVNF